MRARKYLNGKQRLLNLAYGLAGMCVAALVATYGNFELSGVVAFVIGAIAAGGIFRGLFGFDEV